MPATTVVRPSVFVIETSPSGDTVVESVAALSLGSGSTTPAGAATVAVLATVPTVSGATTAVTVKVAVPAGARSTVVAMSPVPDAAAQLPPVATQVHVAPVSSTGIVSSTGAATTADGPALVTVTV